MKQLLLFAAFLVAGLYNAQDTFSKDENGLYTIMDIVEVPNSLQKDLYSKSIVFFTKKNAPNFESIQSRDDNNSRLIAKTFTNLRTPKIGDTTIFPTWDVNCKDGKCKVIISNITFTHVNRPGELYNLENIPKSWFGKERYISDVQQSIKSSLLMFKEYLEKEESKDW